MREVIITITKISTEEEIARIENFVKQWCKDNFQNYKEIEVKVEEKNEF